MRDLTEVIDEILAVEELPEELRAPLEDVKSSAHFAPPENWRIFWQLAAENLQRVLGKPDCDWKHRIHAIFTSREAQPLREGPTKTGTKTWPDWKPRPPRPAQDPPSQRPLAEGYQPKARDDFTGPGSPPQGGSGARSENESLKALVLANQNAAVNEMERAKAHEATIACLERGIEEARVNMERLRAKLDLAEHAFSHGYRVIQVEGGDWRVYPPRSNVAIGEFENKHDHPTWHEAISATREKDDAKT